MISKLRKKLIILFLIFTMSAFSVVLTLMGIYTVSRVRNSQTQYVNNLADSLLEQLQSGSSLDELDLTYYAKQSKCFVYVTDGKSQMDSGALLGEKTAKLIEKIKEEANITSSQEYSSLNGIIETHIDSRFDYADRSWYGIRRIFSGNMQLEMVLICSGPNLVGILWRYCGWYPVIWLLLFTTMYFMSRFLIAKALDPVGKSIQSQKEFVASASHELKAPLSVIQVNAETIHTGDSVRKQETILEECSRMAGLIQSLLILETSDAGSWKLNIKEADVDTILIEEWYAFIFLLILRKSLLWLVWFRVRKVHFDRLGTDGRADVLSVTQHACIHGIRAAHGQCRGTETALMTGLPIGSKVPVQCFDQRFQYPYCFIEKLHFAFLL